MKRQQRQALETIARQLVARGKGILAADESNTTMSKRLLAVGAEATPESHRCTGEVRAGRYTAALEHELAPT